MGTNGTLLPQGFEHISCIDRYVLPLESMDVKSHDAMRKFGESHHGMIMECLERLKKARKSLTLSTVITDFNKDDILELANFIREYDRDTEHVHAWHLTSSYRWAAAERRTPTFCECPRASMTIS